MALVKQKQTITDNQTLNSQDKLLYARDAWLFMSWQTCSSSMYDFHSIPTLLEWSCFINTMLLINNHAN